MGAIEAIASRGQGGCSAESASKAEVMNVGRWVVSKAEKAQRQRSGRPPAPVAGGRRNA